MEENIISNEDNLESGEGRGTENQELRELEDATTEPRSVVEETGSIEQSEGVQAVFEAVVDNTITTENAAETPTTAADQVTDGKSEGTAKDPLTGKGGESQSSGEKSSDDPVMEQSPERQQVPEGISDAKQVGHEPSEVPYTEIDGVEPRYEMDHKESDTGGDINTGSSPLGGKTGEIGPQRIGEGNLPGEEQLPIGKGKDGFIFAGGGRIIPGGGKGMPGGSSTSGGGLPVGGRGGGGVGKEKEGDGYHSGKGPTGHWLEMKAMRDGTPGVVPEPDGKGNWVQDENGDWHYVEQETDSEEAPAEKPPSGDTFDGDQPMPYTGGSTGGGKPDPDEPQGGLDRESGKVFPVIPKGGGSGDSGGRTPGDKDGDDDSGKFLDDPDLTGGPDLGDPDFPDYYTPNVLDDVNDSKKTGRK